MTTLTMRYIKGDFVVIEIIGAGPRVPAAWAVGAPTARTTGSAGRAKRRSGPDMPSDKRNRSRTEDPRPGSVRSP